MSRIPVHLVQEVVARVDFVGVLSQYLTLRPGQGRLIALCPFHAEKTPSFSVNPERGLWHCFGCHAGGDLFKFLMRIEGWTFQEAVREMGRRVGVDVDQLTPEERRRYDEKQRLQDVVERAAAHYHQLLKTSPQAEEARAYLRRRGIRDETVDAFRLGYAPAEWGYLLGFMKSAGCAEGDLAAAGLATDGSRGRPVDMFRDRVMFPILDPHGRAISMGGRLLGDGQPKYLNGPETKLFSKRHNLYALYQARRVLRTEDAVLVEGYMDVVALHQAGFPQAVAALGTALTAEQVALLRRYGSGCVLAYDADNAGQSATEKGIEIFEAASLPVRVLELPPGDDPDSLVGREGPDAFRARLEKASGIVEYRMERLVRKHDVDTPEGKTAFLKEMLPTLGKIRDVVRWDEYVRMLAERLRAREETVRMLARNHRPPGAPVPQSAPPQQWKRNGGRGYGDRSYPRTPVEPPPTPQHLGAAMTPAVLKAERELVRYLLAQPDALPEARAAVSVEEMQDPTLRAILSCLYEMPQPRANLTAADFVPLLEQEGVHKRLSELLMDEHLEPLTPQLFAGLIKNFQDRRARAALKSLGGAVRRALADQNTRRHDDPDFVQFQEHQQRLKGSS